MRISDWISDVSSSDLYIARADAFQRPCRKGETQSENTARQSADQDRLGGRPLPRCCNDMGSLDHLRPLFFSKGALTRAGRHWERIAADRRDDAAQRRLVRRTSRTAGLTAGARARQRAASAGNGRSVVGDQKFPRALATAASREGCHVSLGPAHLTI